MEKRYQIQWSHNNAQYFPDEMTQLFESLEEALQFYNNEPAVIKTNADCICDVVDMTFYYIHYEEKGMFM